MKPLPEEFRARAAAWGNRPPARPPAEVATRARAGRRLAGSRTRLVPRLALAAAALAGVIVVTLARPRPPAPARVVGATPTAPRLVVVELATGSRLYVDLNAAVPRRKP